jgi:pyrrolidone-carboxylate peptidase
MFSLLCALLAVSKEVASLPLVLVTGFSPFDHKSENPSAEIAAALNGTCSADACFDALVLPVSSQGASKVAELLSATNTSRWDLILQLGEDVPAQFMKVTKLHVETVAQNIKSRKSEHATGNGTSSGMLRVQNDNTLVPGGQPYLPTTVDIGRPFFRTVNATLAAQVMWHRDAGQYFCNEAFYRTLFAVRSANIAPASTHSNENQTTGLLPAIFVHVPPSTVISVAEAQKYVTQIAGSIVTSPVVNAPAGAGAAAAAAAAAAPAAAAAAPAPAAPLRVLVTGYSDRLGPDRSGAAAVRLNGTTHSVNATARLAGCRGSGSRKPGTGAALPPLQLKFEGMLLDSSGHSTAAAASAVADALKAGRGWDAIIHVAVQQDRMQKGVALQAVAYRTKRGAQGDEGDIVVPSTANLQALNPPSVVGTGDEQKAKLTWARDNSELNGLFGDTYFDTLSAVWANPIVMRPATPVMFTFLPYGSGALGADTATVLQVAGLVARSSLCET